MKKIGIRFLVLILIFIIVFTFVHIFLINDNAYAALSATYTQYIKSGISAFPESYQKKLAYLKYLHPNWEFKAYYTGINWDELTSTSAENACMRNTVHKGNLLDPAALCRCGQQGDAGYYDASNIMVKYYLDPRNFLGEAMVFQFLDLSDGEGITRDIVLSATKGTYLEQYTDDIMSAASESRISPLHIVATIFQELGRTGTPRAISGTVSGYEGYYNFYNYGATDGDGAVERGLAKAIEMHWDNPRFALIDGAKQVLSSNYVSAGQTTKYFYKFDVVGNEILTESMGKRTYSSGNFYWHQYMTNVRDPSSQAGSLYDIYADNKILDAKLTFTIPVYDNMPATVSTPTSLTAADGNLYYISSLKKYGIQLRSGPGTWYSSYGNLYKDTIVVLISNQGAWSQVKIKAATSFNNTTKQWNYETKTGWVSSEYLTKVGTDIPDYRGQVDMGSGTVYSGETKVDGMYLFVTPDTKLGTINSKYSNAVVKHGGVQINDNSQMIATGDIATIDGKNYTCIKYGDVNGDGNVKSTDYVLIKNNIMDEEVNPFTEIQKLAGDVNKDGNIKASDYVLIKNYIMNGDEISI